MIDTLNENRLPPAKIKYGGQVFIADMKKFQFIQEGNCKCIIPFHRFCENDWYALDWELYMPDYAKMISNMYLVLINCHAMEQEIKSMFNCVKHFLEQEEMYEKLSELQFKRPMLFTMDIGGPIDSSTQNVNGKQPLIKACPPNQRYVYDNMEMRSHSEEVFQTQRYSYFRVHLVEGKNRQQVYDFRIEKAGMVFGKRYKRDSKFESHYYQVVSKISSEAVGYLHVYVGPGGIKEIHYSVRVEWVTMVDAISDFVFGYGIQIFGYGSHGA